MNIAKNIEIIVKLKTHQCVVDYDQKKIRNFRHCQRFMNIKNKSIFIWKSQWNFIWIKFDNDRVLFLTRDFIFVYWWNVSMKNFDIYDVDHYKLN